MLKNRENNPMRKEVLLLKKISVKNKIIKREILLASLIIMVTLLSVISVTARKKDTCNAIEEQSSIFTHVYEFDEAIQIIYDPSDETTSIVANSLCDSLSMIYRPCNLRAITSFKAIKNTDSVKTIIRILVLKSNFTHVLLGNKSVSWKNFVGNLRANKQVHHILAMGNGETLARYLTQKDLSFIHYEGGEVLDAKLAFFYSLWQVGEVLNKLEEKFHDVAIDILKMGIKFFTDNVNDLVQRQYSPINPLGVENETEKQIEFEKRFAEKHPTYLSPKMDIRSMPEGMRPKLYLVGAEGAVASGDVKIGEVPIKSGLQGPVGGIVDALISVLINKIGKDIYLKESTVDVIKSQIEKIKEVFGFFETGRIDPSSELGEVISYLRNEFPVKEEYKIYYPVIVNALANLRGDYSSINTTLGNMLELIIPDTASKYRTLTQDLIGLSQSSVADLKDSKNKNFLDMITANLSSQYLDHLMKNFLARVINMNTGDPDFDIYKTRLLLFLKSIVNILKSIGTEIDYLAIINHVDDSLSLKIQSLMKMIIVATGLSRSPLNLALKDFLSNFIPISDNNFDEILENILNQISKAKEEPYHSVSDFIADTKDILTPLVSDVNLRNLLVTATTMEAGVMNDDFEDLENIPKLNDTLESILQATSHSLTSQQIQELQMVITGVMGTIAIVTQADECKTIVSPVQFDNLFSNNPKRLIEEVFRNIIPQTITRQQFNYTTSLVMSNLRLLHEAKMDSVRSFFQLIIQFIALSLIEENNNLKPEIVYDVVSFLFPSAFGLTEEDILPSYALLTQMDLKVRTWGLTTAEANQLRDEYRKILMGDEEGSGLFLTKPIFTDGLRWLFGQLMDFVEGRIEYLATEITDSLTQALKDSKVEWEGSYDISMGPVGSFNLVVGLGMTPHATMDENSFSNWMIDTMFKGLDPFTGLGGAEGFFEKIMDFVSILPVFTAKLEVRDFSSPTIDSLLASFGVELTMDGGAEFEILLVNQKGLLSPIVYFKLIGWKFWFKLTLTRTITILDIFTGGSAGALNIVGKYIGIDMISVDVFLSLYVEVTRRVASAIGPEEGSFTLKLTIGATLNIGMGVKFFGLQVGLFFYGTLEIVLTFFQDLVNPVPLKIYLEVIFRIDIIISSLLKDKQFTWIWQPDIDGKKQPIELTPTDPEDMEKNGAKGLDFDGDGLSDDYEGRLPGMNPKLNDTDWDGLSDKFEAKILKTDPIKPDTDGDGLDDFIEYYNTKTNPKQPDTDWDGISDYDEVMIYFTNPFDSDSDNDGLSDNYEINHAYNISIITPSVTEIKIGTMIFNDRTDPLNPDTDGDGLLDGEEGDAGPYYGLGDLYNVSFSGIDNPPLIFNNGYTHPLDNDTDDDSYQQLYDGSIIPNQSRHVVTIQGGKRIYTTDGWEVKGMPIVFMINGEPVVKIIRTNPCNPDSDGDTGIAPYTRTNFPFTEILASDGYELSLDPPSDPMDSDTDDDGLIDGLEGTLKEDSNHTNYNNPDTDGDGLGDLQELLLGSNPRHPDSDRDMVTDGQEYLLFGTSVFNPDTDFDGVLDGEELFWYHTDPFSIDSDGDGINDWMELFVYFTDPMDEDTDNDRLSDWEELNVYGTNPLDPDSDTEDWNDINNNGYYDGYWEFDPDCDENGNGVWDGDYIRDGDEVFGTITGRKTNPLAWDTDYDSLTYFVVYPGGYIDYTFRVGDGEEILFYGTDPTYGDTDLDGLTDGWELYSRENIPNYQSIELDPNNNDSDGDGLLDGQELNIRNFTSLIYPYIAFTYYSPFGTSPTDPDSDNDGLSDYIEIQVYKTDPNQPDTDNDTLSDYDEVMFHLTDPKNNDTDADMLLDCDELTAIAISSTGGGSGSSFPSDIGMKLTSVVEYQPKYLTLANDSDYDDDFLPDGLEVLDNIYVPQWGINISYNSDPFVKDSVRPGVLDGYAFDFDHDGLSDGFEIYGNVTDPSDFTPTTIVPGGGPYNPDSDRDGLLDGAEYFIYKTNASNYDTDGDNFSDGLEITIGTDPLNKTSYEELMSAIDGYREQLAILSPIDEEYNTSTITVTVANFTNVESIDYEIMDKQSNLLRHSSTLTYSRERKLWESLFIQLPKGLYRLSVHARRYDGFYINKQIIFSVNMPIPSNSEILMILSVLFGTGSFIGTLGFIVIAKKTTPVLIRKIYELKGGY
ncbi:MAG: hypothetical protein ACTSW1_00485 [Candidatus Hodarchaeales archaeon]